MIILLDHLAMIQCTICFSVVHAGSRLPSCKQQQQQQQQHHGWSREEVKSHRTVLRGPAGPTGATEDDALRRFTVTYDALELQHVLGLVLAVFVLTGIAAAAVGALDSWRRRGPLCSQALPQRQLEP